MIPVPLETTPLYSADSYPDRSFMSELTTASNAIARLQPQLLAPTLHGAHISKPPILHTKRQK